MIETGFEPEFEFMDLIFYSAAYEIKFKYMPNSLPSLTPYPLAVSQEISN